MKKIFTGNFEEFLKELEYGILDKSMTASYEGNSDYQANGVSCAVRVFERYSMLGGNRVSLSLALLGHNENLFLSAMTSGGSQAVLFKVNTFGEESFLDCVKNITENYIASLNTYSY